MLTGSDASNMCYIFWWVSVFSAGGSGYVIHRASGELCL